MRKNIFYVMLFILVVFSCKSNKDLTKDEDISKFYDVDLHQKMTKKWQEAKPNNYSFVYAYDCGELYITVKVTVKNSQVISAELFGYPGGYPPIGENKDDYAIDKLLARIPSQVNNYLKANSEQEWLTYYFVSYNETYGYPESVEPRTDYIGVPEEDGGPCCEYISKFTLL